MNFEVSPWNHGRTVQPQRQQCEAEDQNLAAKTLWRRDKLRGTEDVINATQRWRSKETGKEGGGGVTKTTTASTDAATATITITTTTLTRRRLLPLLLYHYLCHDQ